MAGERQYQDIAASGNARQQNGDYYNTTTNNYYGAADVKQTLGLLYAALDGNLDRVKHLVEQRAMDVEAEDEEGLTALHCAAWAGSKECFEYLIDRGAYIHHRSNIYGSLLTLLAFQDHREWPWTSLDELKIEVQASAFSTGLLGTPLHAYFAGKIARGVTLVRGHSSMVDKLIHVGVPVNAVRDVDLGFATLLTQNILLCRRYSSNSRNRCIVTGSPLNLAVRTRSYPGVCCLIASGANVNSPETAIEASKRRESVTPLMRACHHDGPWHVGMCDALLCEDETDCGLQDSHGYTALMRAASNGFTHGVEVILKSRKAVRHLWVDLQNHAGRTALMLAAVNGYNVCVDMLLASGARTELKDNKRKTALKLARESRNDLCADMIERHNRSRR